MSQESNYLFPIVLDILSNKPQYSENENILLKDIAKKLREENITAQDLKLDLAAVVNVGTSLGILTARGDEIRLPFLLKGNKPNGVRNTLQFPVRFSQGAKEDTVLPRDSEDMNEIPTPNWMERDMRNIHPDSNQNRNRSRSRSHNRRSSKSQESKAKRGMELLRRRRHF